MNMQLFIIAITPAIAIALATYFTDRYDKEPLDLLIKIFLLGAASVIPTSMVEKLLMSFNIFNGMAYAAFTGFIVAGCTEEFFKRTVVVNTAFKSKEFNEKLDGIIYCVFSALGFATVENIIYVVFRFSANPYVGLYRGILSVPAHVLFGITMGYYLSLAKFAEEKDKARISMIKSIIIPIILHGFFDFILMVNIPLMFLVFIPFILYLWFINLKKLNEYYTESRANYEIQKRGMLKRK